MYKSLITLRYAKALFLEAQKQGQAEVVLGDVQRILKTFENFPEINQVIQHPVILSSKKQQILKELLQDKVSPVMLRFLNLVVRNKREFYLRDIFRNYRDLYNEHHGIKTVQLTTALPLGDPEKEAIKGLIRKHFQAKKVDFYEHINKQIIGGFVIQIEDQLLDASVRRQLESIRKTLMDKNYRVH